MNTRVVLYVPDADEDVSGLARTSRSRGVHTLSVTRELLERAADTESPQGILAISDFPDLDVSVGDTSPLLLIADQIRDPGNLGTLIRSAHGAGAHAMLVTPGTVDPYSPKVVRAGMGSHFQLPIQVLDWSHPPTVLTSCTTYAAVANGNLRYDDVDWSSPTALIVGNETNGPSDAALGYAFDTVGIPLAVTLESLNAGVAGSVILFEAARQRRKG